LAWRCCRHDHGQSQSLRVAFSGWVPRTARAGNGAGMMPLAVRGRSGSSAVLLIGLALLGGCGSATQSPTRSSAGSQNGSDAGSGAASMTTTARTATASTTTAASPAPRPVSSAGAHSSVVRGQTVGSRCVFSRGATARCSTRPVQAMITVLSTESGRRVASTHTDAASRFRLRLRPGGYELLARPSDQLLFSRSIPIRVHAGHVKHLIVVFYRRHPLPVGPVRETELQRRIRAVRRRASGSGSAGGGCGRCAVGR
jgi:hypothetical protein